MFSALQHAVWVSWWWSVLPCAVLMRISMKSNTQEKQTETPEREHAECASHVRSYSIKHTHTVHFIYTLRSFPHFSPLRYLTSFRWMIKGSSVEMDLTVNNKDTNTGLGTAWIPWPARGNAVQLNHYTDRVHTLCYKEQKLLHHKSWLNIICLVVSGIPALFSGSFGSAH